MRFFIYGGCVTRDIFRIAPQNAEIVNYFARSSLISQMHPRKISVDMQDINLKSNFQKQMVFNDLNKIFPHLLDQSNADYIVIDFLVERLNLKRSYNSFFTRSNEFLKSGLEQNKKYNFGRTVYRDDSLLDLWFSCCDIFIEQIKKKYKNENIILHKVYWANKYKDENGNLFSFDIKLREEAEINNRMLEKYYSYFEEKSGCKTIQTESGKFFADRRHKWGLNPMHYERDYYLNVRKQINKIVRQNSLSKIRKRLIKI